MPCWAICSRTGLRLPRQNRNLVGQTIILWDRASYSQVYQILKLPAYAGVYVYGQRRRKGCRRAGHTLWRAAAPAEWQVLLRDAFPGYITWQEYMENQEKLAQNWQATPLPTQPTPGQWRFAGTTLLRQRRGGKGGRC
ncbi:MAG: recombinase family protein [Ardenticatenaceae bacterium]|nr:recombinase family protein [Ardenticatenaceae bacterium]